MDDELTGMYTADLDLKLNFVFSLVVQLVPSSPSPSIKTELKFTEFLNIKIINEKKIMFYNLKFKYTLKLPFILFVEVTI